MTKKNSTILYHEWLMPYEDELTDAEFGQLFKAIVHYDRGDEAPVFEDRLLKTIWNQIKADIDTNREKWEKTCKKNKENGTKGGRPKKPETVNSEEEKNPVGFSGNEKKPSGLMWDKNKTQKTLTNDLMTNELLSNDNNIPPYNPPKGEKRFTPPTVDEVRAYCLERKNNIDPEEFVDFYTSKGWKVGKTPMKDWKASVRTWERKERASPKKNDKQTEFNNFHQRKYNFTELEKQLLAK